MEVRTHIQSATSLLQAVEQYPGITAIQMDQKNKPASTNSMHQKQLRFFSTKKKRETTKCTLSKPKPEEQATCISFLRETEIRVCGTCFLE